MRFAIPIFILAFNIYAMAYAILSIKKSSKAGYEIPEKRMNVIRVNLIITIFFAMILFFVK